MAKFHANRKEALLASPEQKPFKTKSVKVSPERLIQGRMSKQKPCKVRPVTRSVGSGKRTKQNFSYKATNNLRNTQKFATKHESILAYQADRDMAADLSRACYELAAMGLKVEARAARAEILHLRKRNDDPYLGDGTVQEYKPVDSVHASGWDQDN